MELYPENSMIILGGGIFQLSSRKVLGIAFQGLFSGKKKGLAVGPYPPDDLFESRAWTPPSLGQAAIPTPKYDLTDRR